MTRKEEIKEASINYQLAKRPKAIGGDAFADEVRELNANPTFVKAAEWADKTMIEKVCKWIDDNIEKYILEGRNGKPYISVALTDDLRRAMEIEVTEENNPYKN